MVLGVPFGVLVLRFVFVFGFLVLLVVLSTALGILQAYDTPVLAFGNTIYDGAGPFCLPFPFSFPFSSASKAFISGSFSTFAEDLNTTSYFG